MKGRKPTPTAILKARGSWRAKIRDDEPAVEVASEVPVAPSHLEGEALECWVSTAQELVGARVLAKTDLRALTRYCEFWKAWREESDVKIKMQIDQRMIKLEEQFGLTPSARARVKVTDHKKPEAAKSFGGLKVAK